MQFNFIFIQNVKFQKQFTFFEKMLIKNSTCENFDGVGIHRIDVNISFKNCIQIVSSLASFFSISVFYNKLSSDLF